MEVILLLGLIILLIIIVSGNSRLQAQLRQMDADMHVLHRQLQQLLERRDSGETATPARPMPAAQKPVIPAPVPPMPPKPVTEPSPVPEQVPSAEPGPVPVPEQTTMPAPPAAVAQTPRSEPEPAQAAPAYIPPPSRPGFFERNPDLEKFIGENLIPKIGIAILVIAIGFFVKYAIDQDWIGPAGRVAIGMLCGGILIGIAHKLQRSYKAFSSVLVGGGLAVFYFSIALAYKDYGLLSQAAAFIIMVVITIFAIVLSLLYDRQEVAIISLAGGFAVPFLVSSGSGNYITLFSYLLVLNTGLLVIAYRKAWRLLNLIAFLATALIFWGWLGTLAGTAPARTYTGGLLFGSAFYLLFLAINLAHNLRERKQFLASDFGILLAVNCLYFSAGLYMLYQAGAEQYKGLFSAALGVLNFALAFAFVRYRNIDKSILYLLVGITLTFVSMTAPLQLQGHSITLFWAAESVVLLWLMRQSGIRILQWGLLAVWICSIVSLAIDWVNVYGSWRGPAGLLPVIVNKGFITTIFVAAANGALYRLMLRPEGEMPFPSLREGHIGSVFGSAAIMLLYVAGAFETGYQLSHRYAGLGIGGLYLLLYTLCFVLAIWLLAQKNILRLRLYTGIICLAGCLFLYLAFLPHAYLVQEKLLGARRMGHFTAHWLSAVLIALIFYQAIRTLRGTLDDEHYRVALTWAGAAFAVTFVSVELHLLIKAIAYRNEPGAAAEITRNYIRVGLPIIWGLCSFALMWLGMRYKYRPLRIASLSLFSLTLLKLFLFDIRDAGVAGKIAAFFSLGVLLLVVSFMYQRLKRLIIEDERKTDAD